jgi:hypothetical protein
MVLDSAVVRRAEVSMRRAAKTDHSQAPIIAALRANGMSVKDCRAVGQGFPDLCIGFRGGTYLIETKSDKRISHRVSEPLTAAQKVFHSTWAGAIGVVSTPEEAVDWVMRTARAEGRI